MRIAWYSGMAVMLLATSTAPAVERFPPPDFSDHELPRTEMPAARAELYEYLDLAVLGIGLGMATHFAIGRRSRRGLFVVTVVCLGWLGFWRGGCICPIGAIQNVSLALFEPGYALPWSVAIVFGLPLVVTLFFGRTFCAAVCPLGAIQELVALRPVKVPLWLDQALGLLAYVYLGLGVIFAATGAAFIICRYDPFVALFRLGGSMNLLVLGASFLVAGVFVGRPYCRYLCPYGAILGLLSKVSKWHAKIPPEECIQCRLCEEACPYGAIREPTVAMQRQTRQQGRRRLAAVLIALPLFVAGGFWLGQALQGPMAKVHPAVRLAERVHAESVGLVSGTTDASEAFRTSGRSLTELDREASAVYAKSYWAGGWFGAWMGLVIGGKLLYLTVRRRRAEYQPDRASCVSCGRCFWYCPSEQARQGWVQLTPGRQ